MVIDINFDFNDARVPKKDIKSIASKILPSVKHIISKDYSKGLNFNCLNQPLDIDFINQSKELTREKRVLHPEMIILVGIGGSNLGTLAVEKAVIDEYKAHKEGLPTLTYADTVDSDLMYKISKDIELSLAKGRNVLLIAISKSGTTLETISNFEILIDSLKIYKEDYKKYIVTISDSGSPLTEWANKNNISNLIIPSFVGGRYSVFSPSSLFPLCILGVNIDEFISGAKDMHSRCLDINISNNPALISAAIHFYHYKKGVNISNTFFFSKNLENVGKWYRQLLAESLGKEKDLKNKKVNFGLTPIISLGTDDLHSIEQLCIAGPYDKLTNLVCVREKNHEIGVPLISNTHISKYIHGHDLKYIMHGIILGVKKSFISKKRPIIVVEMKDSLERSVGEFMMWKMFEVVYLGILANVNPFDQPAVEEYKDSAKKFLSKNAL